MIAAWLLGMVWQQGVWWAVAAGGLGTCASLFLMCLANAAHDADQQQYFNKRLAQIAKDCDTRVQRMRRELRASQSIREALANE